MKSQSETVAGLSNNAFESSLHKVGGLISVLSSYSTGDWPGEGDLHNPTTIYHALGVVVKLLTRAQEDASQFEDLPTSWGVSVAEAVAMAKAIRGQFLTPDTSVSTHYESASSEAELSNALWALRDHIDEVITAGLYPHSNQAASHLQRQQPPQQH